MRSGSEGVTPPRPRGRSRFLLPSIADLLFVGLLLTRVQPTLFHDGDTGWHLWAGVSTVRDGLGAIPDGLSFTRPAAPFETVEWLGEVLLAMAYLHAGYLGIAVLAGVVFAGTFSWLYRILLRTSGDPVASILVTVLAAQVTLLQFLARPLVFSFPLFLGTIELCRGGSRRAAVCLPLLTVLWANIHPSAYFAPAIAGFFWLRKPGRNGLGLAALLSLAALGATPWGYRWVTGMLAENRAYFAHVEEWTSPDFRQVRFLPYLLGIVLAVAARWRAPSLPVSTMLWGLGWLGAALSSARFGPYAFLAWAPFLARDLAQGGLRGCLPPVRRAWDSLREGLAGMEAALRPRLWPWLCGAGAIAFAGSLQGLYPDASRGFPGDRFPEAALAEAPTLGVGPHVFSEYGWGGYVGWESRGAFRVFIDGRAGFFGPELLQDYLTAVSASSGWEKVLRRWRPDWMLLSPGSPLAAAAERSGGWTIIRRDAVSVILIPTRGGSGWDPRAIAPGS